MPYGRDFLQNQTGGVSDCRRGVRRLEIRAMAKTGLPETPMTNPTPTHDEIAAQAYQIYLREGCPEGRDLDHWLQSEVELRTRTNENATRNDNGMSSEANERSERAPESNGASKTEVSVLPNSVVPPSAPIAQVSRANTPARKGSNKREPAAAGR